MATAWHRPIKNAIRNTNYLLGADYSPAIPGNQESSVLFLWFAYGAGLTLEGPAADKYWKYLCKSVTQDELAEYSLEKWQVE